MSSAQPRWSATRYAPASCTRNAHSAGETEDAGARTALMGVLSGRLQRDLSVLSAAGAGVGLFQEELLHVPGAGRAALGAQAAVQAHVLVLHHDSLGLQWARDVEVLRRVPGRTSTSRAH